VNKKFKIVSSVALAGLLSINLLSPKALATTIDDKIETNPVGKYRNLVEGKAVVPYILVSTEDRVTVKEIVNSNEFSNVTKFNGTSIPNENTVVSTGDTFEADGTEYTVIIYGDVNKDGRVNSQDALLVEEYSTELTTLDTIQLEAADVVNDGKVNSLDSLRIKEFSAELTTPVIDKAPEAEKPAATSTNYTVNVNKNDKISNQNASETILKVKIEKTLDKDATFTVKVVGSDGKEVTIAKDVDGSTLTIPAHKDLVEVKLDLSSIPDGKIAGTLFVGNDKAGTEFKTEKSTVTPEATNIRTNRVNTKSATLSLESCGETELTKVYYEVVKNGEAQPNKIEKTAKVSNGKVNAETVATDLETNTAYDVWYVLEDSFGSKSAAQKATITSDSSAVKDVKKVKEVKEPKLEEVVKAEFTWEAERGVTYTATLYKDGKAVASQKVSEGLVDFTDDMKEEGTYKVEVYAEATANTRASEPTASKEVKVEKLPSVTDLKFVNENDKITLTWNNPNKEEDYDSYEIELVTIDEEGKESQPTTYTMKEKENKYDMTYNIAENTIYKAKVTVIAKEGQMAKIDSEETVTEQFYKVGEPSIDQAETTEHSIVITSDGININGKKATYKVKIFDVNEKATLEEPRYILKETRNVEIKDGKITLDNLNSDTLYAFKLIATIDGTDSESDYSSPVKTLPEIKNLTVVATEKEAKEAGKVYAKSADILVIAGEEKNLGVYNNSTKLANSMKLINALEPGDTVSIEDDKVSVKLDGGASANVSERDLTSCDLTKTALTVESNDFSKTLKISKVKELTLKGTGSIFNLDSVTAEKIVLTNGVEVTASKKQNYSVSAGSQVTMNKLSMTTGKDVVVTANGSDFTVEANTVSNDLVFENKKGEEVTITFKGKDDNTSTQSGTITIKENAKVTVKSEKVNVSADLKVEVNNGDIDLTEPSFTGNKDITVAKDATTTVKAVANTAAPIALTNFELKDYTNTELKDMFGDDADKVKEYINSFGINEKGATLTVAKGSKNVTITFEKVDRKLHLQKSVTFPNF